MTATRMGASSVAVAGAVLRALERALRPGCLLLFLDVPEDLLERLAARALRP